MKNNKNIYIIKTVFVFIVILFVYRNSYAQTTYTQSTYKGKAAWVYPYKHQFYDDADFEIEGYEIPPVTDSLPDGLWVMHKPFPPKPDFFLNAGKALKKWERKVAKLKAKPLITAWFMIKNGKKNGQCQFFISKNLTIYGQYLNDEKDSIWTHINSKDKKQFLYSYSHGLIHGKYKEYEKNKLVSEGFYSENKRVGQWIYYYSNGQISDLFTYADSIGVPKYPYVDPGDYHGLFISYYKNGQIQNEKNYIYGYTVYDDTCYYKDGQIEKIYSSYKNSDSLVKVIIFDKKQHIAYEALYNKVNMFNFYSKKVDKNGIVQTFDIDASKVTDTNQLILAEIEINTQGDTIKWEMKNKAKSIFYQKGFNPKTQMIIEKEIKYKMVDNKEEFTVKRTSTSLKNQMQIVEYNVSKVKTNTSVNNRILPVLPFVIGANNTIAEQHDSVRIFYKGQPLNAEAYIVGIDLYQHAKAVEYESTRDNDLDLRNKLQISVDTVKTRFDTYWVIQLDIGKKYNPKKLIKSFKYNNSSTKTTKVTLKDGYFYDKWIYNESVYITFGEKGMWDGQTSAYATTYYKNGKAHGPRKDYSSCFATYKDGKLDGHLVLQSDYGGISAQGTYKNGIPEGPYVLYNSRNDTMRFSNFKNGYEEGDVYTWSVSEKDVRYLSGASKAINGYLYGPCYEYFPDGVIKTKAIYKLEDSIDIYDGSYNHYDMQTTRKGQYQFFYKNGLLASEGIIGKSYVKTGEWKNFNESGGLIEKVNYFDTTIVNPFDNSDSITHFGYFESFYDNGKMKEKGYIIDSKYSNDCSQDRYVESVDLFYLNMWLVDGTQNIVNGNGELKLYHNNGQKKAQGKIYKGKREGIWVLYDPNGNPNETGLYINGKKEGRWLSGDLKGINFIDNQCFDDEATALYFAEQSKHDIELTITIYKNDAQISTNFFKKKLDEE